jgi:hypothetical protein
VPQQSEYGKLGSRASSDHTETEPHFLGFQASKHRSQTMGISNPEIQKKVFGPRWEHEIEKQGWRFLEKAHAPTAGLSYMQAQITNSKTSMSAIACGC